MIKNYKVTPISELTAEVVDKMIIHQTQSSLDRACSMSPHIQRVEGTEAIPTLYYVKGSSNPRIDDYTIHALQTDINRFLLMDFVLNGGGTTEAPTEEPTEEPAKEPYFVASTINWDPGKTGGEGLSCDIKNGFVTFHGEIAWYPADEALGRTAGNRVGVVITPGEGMIETYPDVKIYIGNAVYGKEVFNEYPNYEPKNSLYYYPLIKVLGQENPVRIVWQDGLEERFIVAVTQESTLQAEQ